MVDISQLERNVWNPEAKIGLIHKVDANGNFLWLKNLCTTQYSNRAYDIKQTADNGFVLTESLSDIGTGSENYVVIKLDSEGEVVWKQLYGLIGPFATTLTLTADSGYFVAGNSNGLGFAGGSNALLFPLPTGTSEEIQGQKICVLPNPNAGQFSITTSDADGSINVRMYDLQGKTIYFRTEIGYKAANFL